MEKRRNLIVLFTIFIIFTGGVLVYKVKFPNIDSNVYLSNKNESHKSFNSKTNDKSDKNSKSFDFEKFDGNWSLMQFTSNKGNEININDNTKISKGKFYIVVLDSEYNIVAKKNEVNETGNIKFITKKVGNIVLELLVQMLAELLT
ncbi:hypothetical protein [Anaerocolumna sp.]|uniref:hypothetical protein n=1 Tax=Anaerocolumna sp. TaxID=2041569 RepID=UPI002F3ECD5F